MERQTGMRERRQRERVSTEIHWKTHLRQRISVSGSYIETWFTPMMVGTSVGGSQKTRIGRLGDRNLL